MFKFIHAADVHLDSPLVGLQKYDGAPVDQIRGATRKALANLVDLSMREQAKFLLIAGDVYDGSWKDYNTGLFFVKEMSRLRDAGIRVLLICGNHDSQSEITRTLRLPDNVQMLSTTKAETKILEDLGVAIHGQGFASREVKENLVSGYPDAVPGLLNIGMLHTSCTGRDGHDTYAPCTLNDLLGKQYDYWALGHIHGREEMRREPWIIFPGNLQGRHIRETGGKGASVVSVQGNAIAAVEHRDLDVFRWALCAVDAAGANDDEEVLTRVAVQIESACGKADGRALAIRLHVTGECRAHAGLAADAERWKNEARSVAVTSSSGRVWIEQVKLATSLPGVETAADQDGPESDLAAILAELEESDQAIAEFAGGFADLEAKLPRDLTVGAGALTLSDKAYLRQLLADVRQTLCPQMHGAAAGEPPR